MYKITVIAKRDERKVPTAQQVYVGRPSPLGNPFAMRNKHDAAERQQVVKQYREWLDSQLQQQNKQVLAELRRIAALAQQHPVYLVCWCAPLACHADVIADTIRQQYSN